MLGPVLIAISLVGAPEGHEPLHAECGRRRYRVCFAAVLPRS